MITALDEAKALAAQALAPGFPTYEVLAVRYGTRMTTRADCYLDYGRLGEPDAPLGMDYFFWLLRSDEQTILVDIGFDPPVGARRGRTLLCDPLEALGRLGVRPASVKQIIVTHLHYDHIGQLAAFPNAELIVQRRELDFWLDPAASAEQAGHVEPRELAHVAAAFDAGRVRVLDGAAIVAPGIGAVLVGGHSPGQQSLVVRTQGSPILLTSDAVHYYEELERNLQFIFVVDLDDMKAGYTTLEALARHTGATLVPGHDPEVAEHFPPVDDFAFRLD